MTNSVKIPSFLISVSFVILAIGVNASAAFGQTCNNFMNTCNVPAFSAFTYNETLVGSTGEVGEPVAHTFYTTVQNPLQTDWIHWTAPMNGVVVANTQGTNPGAAPPTYTTPYVIDTTIAVYTGATLTTLTRIDETDDWTPSNPPNSSCTHVRPGTESVFSSCMMFSVTAGTVYHFQIDHLTETNAANNDYSLNVYYRAPSSATASVSGRITDNSGIGLAKVRVSLTKPNSEIISINTNPFGYYTFEGVDVGQNYTLQADSKRFQFQNNPRIISVSETLQNEDFVAMLE